MKKILTFMATLALTMSAASAAQPRDGYQPAGRDGGERFDHGLGAVADDAEAARAAEDRGIQVAARVVRRGVVVRGPRGGVRTFTYRGRPLAVIRRPAFVYPPGFAYRRWVAGALLPVALIAAPLIFLEYQALGLRPPPPGYVWVRHGPDVILVNERTRKVDEVAYGAIEEE